MKKRDKDLVVQIEDMYGEGCFGDSLDLNSNVPRKPQGRIEIFELDEFDKKKLVSKSNLVVYEARELIAQKIIDTNYAAAIIPDKDEKVCWFGLGDGGVASGDPFDPLSPTNGDDELDNEVLIHATDSILGDYRAAAAYWKIPFDSVEFEQDTANDDRWIVLKFTITVGATYANGTQLSEAGLFTAASALPGALSTGPFHLFSRVTFPSIVKTSTRRLLFVWYLYT